MKGLSAVIGMVFLLITMIAVLVPLAMMVTSTPSKEEENINAVQPMQDEAQEQIAEVNEVNSPVSFYYCNTTGEALLVFYSSPPVPINISYFLGYSGDSIKVIDPQPQEITWDKYPALEYQVGDFNKLALVTTLGNIIYADPLPHIQSNGGDDTASYDPYWIYPLKETYKSYTNPHSLQLCINPSVITNRWKPCGINNAALIVMKQEHKPLCINLTIHFKCCFTTGYRNHGEVGTTIGIYSGSFYGQIEFGNYFLGEYSGCWPYKGFQCILLNVSNGCIVPFCRAQLGVLASYSRLVYETYCGNGGTKCYNYVINIHVNCCCQIYITLYNCKGELIKLPSITPETIPAYYCRGICFPWKKYGICCTAPPGDVIAMQYEGNYNKTEWGFTRGFASVPLSLSCTVPLGRILTTGGTVCGISADVPIKYPCDPIGVAVEILWGCAIYVNGVQVS